MKKACFNAGELAENLLAAAAHLSPENTDKFIMEAEAVARGEKQRAKVRAEGQAEGHAPRLDIWRPRGGRFLAIKDFGDETKACTVAIEAPRRSGSASAVAFPDMRPGSLSPVTAEKETGPNAFSEAFRAAPELSADDLRGNYLAAKKSFIFSDLAGLGLRVIETRHAGRVYRNPAAGIYDIESGELIGYEYYRQYTPDRKDQKRLPSGLSLGGRACWMPLTFRELDRADASPICLSEGLATARAAAYLWPTARHAACRGVSAVCRAAETLSRIQSAAPIFVLAEGDAAGSAADQARRALARKHCPGVRVVALPELDGVTLPAHADAWDIWDALGKPRSLPSDGSRWPTLEELADAYDDDDAAGAADGDIFAPWRTEKGVRACVAAVQALLTSDLFPSWGREASTNALCVYDQEQGWTLTDESELAALTFRTCQDLGFLASGLSTSVNAAVKLEVKRRRYGPPAWDRVWEALEKNGLLGAWDGVDRWKDAAEALRLPMGTPAEKAYAVQWIKTLFVSMYARAALDDPFWAAEPSGYRLERDPLKRQTRENQQPFYTVKNDVCFLLSAGQGLAKSTLASVFSAGLYQEFSYTSAKDGGGGWADVERRAAYFGPAPFILLEWSELKGKSEAKANSYKKWMQERTDALRTLYVNDVPSVPRRWALFGTTNQDDILEDPTGDRRFCVIESRGFADLPRLQKMVPQLWAHARVLALGELGGGRRRVADLDIFPDGRRPGDYHEGDFDKLSEDVRSWEARGWVNEGLGRMTDYLLALGHCLGVSARFQVNDPLADAAADFMAAEYTKEPETFPERLGYEGFKLAEIADAVEQRTGARVSAGTQGAKDMAAALKRLGMEKKRTAAGNIWTASPQRAGELFARIMAAADQARKHADGGGVIPFRSRPGSSFQ